MARFDIFRNEGGKGYLLEVQSDLLSGLNTRVVVPLLPQSVAPSPAERLNPVFEVEGVKVVVATQFMASVPESELRTHKGNFAEKQHEISAALDMLHLGFQSLSWVPDTRLRGDHGIGWFLGCKSRIPTPLYGLSATSAAAAS